MEVRTACPLNCWDTCTILATVKDGVVTDVRGDPENPTTLGFLCPKARFQLERMYSPDRLLHPMVRSAAGGKRGTWGEARELKCGRAPAAVARVGSPSPS